jgi:osmotically-inducible protein OsmY
LEAMFGKESFERVSVSNVPIGGPADSPARFELRANDTHDGQGRSDERIKLAVMTALHWDLAVPRNRVHVSVDRGQVTLTGRVARDYEKTRAEADALTVPGVAGVTNRIVLFDGD